MYSSMSSWVVVVVDRGLVDSCCGNFTIAANKSVRAWVPASISLFWRQGLFIHEQMSHHECSHQASKSPLTKSHVVGYKSRLRWEGSSTFSWPDTLSRSSHVLRIRCESSFTPHQFQTSIARLLYGLPIGKVIFLLFLTLSTGPCSCD